MKGVGLVLLPIRQKLMNQFQRELFLEPFIDTVVICTMTAFLIITGFHNVEDLEGSQK